MVQLEIRQMPASAVFPVEPLRVRTAEVLHAAREIRFWRVDDQMEVRSHQAVGAAAPFIERDDDFQLIQKTTPIGGFAEDGLAVDAERRDVMRCVREIDPDLARHHMNVWQPDRARSQWLMIFRSRGAAVTGVTRRFETRPERQGSDPRRWGRVGYGRGLTPAVRVRSEGGGAGRRGGCRRAGGTRARAGCRGGRGRGTPCRPPAPSPRAPRRCRRPRWRTPRSLTVRACRDSRRPRTAAAGSPSSAGWNGGS